jgi:PhoPQ-activated pathogenicity-related protein
VLVVHGAEDRETPPDHSRRVFDALAGPKTLRIVDGAGHNDALGKVWPEVERFIAEVSDPPEQTVRGEPVEPRTDRAGAASPAPRPR